MQPAETLALYRENRDELLKYAGRIVRDRASAEDIVQEAWLKFSDRLQQGGEVSQPLSYLYAIVRNLAGATILLNVRQAGHFVDVSSPYISAEALDVVQANFDRGFGFGIGVAIAILIVLAAVEAWRLGRFIRAGAGPQLA